MDIGNITIFYFREAERNAKRRARQKGLDFTITDDELDDLAIGTNGFCSVTGVEFQLPNKPEGVKAWRNPWAPSLDRIDSAKGYTKENCRFVCVAFNYAVNMWGEEVFQVMVTNYLSKKLDLPSKDCESQRVQGRVKDRITGKSYPIGVYRSYDALHEARVEYFKRRDAGEDPEKLAREISKRQTLLNQERKSKIKAGIARVSLESSLRVP